MWYYYVTWCLVSYQQIPCKDCKKIQVETIRQCEYKRSFSQPMGGLKAAASYAEYLKEGSANPNGVTQHFENIKIDSAMSFK